MTPHRTISFLFLFLFAINFLAFVPEETQAQVSTGFCAIVSQTSVNNVVKTSNDGISWTATATGLNQVWNDIVYAKDQFVAVGDSGGIMTSPNGIDWTSRTSPTNNDWESVTHGNGIYVAVGSTGVDNRVITSSDGVTWVSRTSAANNFWEGIAFSDTLGLFAAVSSSGSGNRVMTSPDGITWSTQTSAANNFWIGITFGDGLFVAVAATGTGNRVMTSPDGITWSTQTSAADNDWFSVAYSPDIDLFVAVAASGAGNRVMTSPDGITWTIQTSAADIGWTGVAWNGGLFIATANTGSGNRIMTSPDGVTWTLRNSGDDTKSGIDVACNTIEIEGECITGFDCTSITFPNTQFKDLRVSYELAPRVYVREAGDNQARRQNHGFIYRLNEAVELQESNQPCDDGVFGTAGWEYTSNDDLFRGLAVTTDEFVIASCMVGQLATSDFTIMKILSPTSLTKVRATGSIGEVTPTRIDAFTRNLVTMPTAQDLFRHVDPLNGLAGDFFSQGQVLGMSMMGPQEGLSILVGTPGVTVFDATNNINSLGLFSTQSISANAALVNSTHLWVFDQDSGHVYTWSVQDGATLVTSDTDYDIDTAQQAEGVRLSKDEDFVIHWSGSTVRIGGALNLTDLFSTSLGGTIQGCDMDMLNNYLYCTTPSTIERLAVFDSLPTAWGVDKEGNLTAANNTTVIEAIGDTYTDQANDQGVSGGDPGVTLPGAEGGFVEDTDNFFGVPLQPVADGFGTSITQVKWLVGIFLTVLIAVSIGATVGLGVGVILGAAVGVGWATAMGLFPVWLILFIVFVILILIGRQITEG